MLRPVDIVVLLRLSLATGRRPLYSRMASDLGLYPSEVHTSLRRADTSHFLQGEGKDIRLNRSALLEFLLHGVRYAFPLQKGAITRGVPTGYAAPPLNRMVLHGEEAVPVWPYARGTVRGQEVSPLHKNVPEAALQSAPLYELLALVDSLRDGKARERRLAASELTARLGGNVSQQS